MRLPLVVAPDWAAALVQGTILFLWWALFSRFVNHLVWWHALVEAAGYSVLLTSAMWFAGRRRRARTESALGPLTPGQRDRACRAAEAGPAPDDPVIRQAAARVVDARLEESRRGQAGATVLLVLFTLFCLLGVAAGSPWWTAGAVVSVGLLVNLWLEPRRIQRRLDALLAVERAQARAQWSRAGTGQLPS